MAENISIKHRVTPLRAAAARNNGRKSKGPKTEQGKKISSRNSLKHALSCSSKTPLLLPGEDATLLSILTHAFNSYSSSAPNAAVLIEQAWRAKRAFECENRNLQALAAEQPLYDDPDQQFAHAWDQLSCSQSTAAVNRHLASARSRFTAAAAQLFP